MLQTPFADLHRAAGAKMAAFAGYNMPIQYNGILAEHRRVREKAGLFDVSHMGQIVIRDPNTAKTLETIIPGDLQSLQIGETRYCLLLNDAGGVVDDAMATRLDDSFFVVVNASRKHDDFALLKTLFAPDSIMMMDHALLALQGPEAEAVLAQFYPDCRAMKFMTAQSGKIDDMDILISRSGYTGEDGFEILVVPQHAEKLAQLLLSDDRVAWIGLGARDTLRLEAGLCLYGHELDETTTPVEANLVWTIGKNRRETFDFAGGAVIQNQMLNGAGRKRVGIALQNRAPAREGTKILDNKGDSIGIVTSGTFSPTLNAPIAMGYVAKEFATIGTIIQLDIRGTSHAAIVTKLPFVPHHYKQG